MAVLLQSIFKSAMLLALAATGCATTIAAQSPLSTEAVALVNQAVEGRVVSVEFVEQHERAATQRPRNIEVKAAEVGRDTTEWIEHSSNGEARRRSVPTAALRRITVRDGKVGALEGLGIGLLAGAVAGGIAGGIIGANSHVGEFGCPGIGCSIYYGSIGALAIGAHAALLLGLPIGALAGHRTTIVLEPGAPRSEPAVEAPKPGASSTARARYAEEDGHWFFGVGASELASPQGAGPGFSLEADYQALHWGVRGEALEAVQTTNSTNPKVTGASVLGTHVFGDSDTGPYLGAGLGYLRQTGGSTDTGTSAAGDGAAAMAEAGILFWRDRIWGRAVWALRLTVPLFSGRPPVLVCATPPNCGGGPYFGGGRTSFPFASLSLRVLL